MKKIVKLIIISAAFVFLSACNLDMRPSASIDRDTSFETYADAARYANGLTSHFRDSQYGFFSYYNEVQADMFNAASGFGNNHGAFHRMDNSFTTGEYGFGYVWDQLYKSIATTNNFIDKIDLVSLNTDAEKANVKAFTGYAHFYRAFYYHALVRYFSKNYDPATASTDLGVPLVLHIDLAEKPVRATVEQIYTQINEDIAKAREYLTGVTGKVNSIVPTIDAVKALDARVKFYTRKYTEAASVAMELISSGTYTLSNTAAAMKAEWLNDNGTEDIMQLFATLTEYGSSAGSRLASSLYLGYSNVNSKYTPYFIPTKTAVDMYESSDLRKSTWFATLPAIFENVDFNLSLFTKYQGNPGLFTPPTPTYAHKAKVFRIAEMYLIRAEALLSQSNPDPVGAKAMLNAIQTARGASLTEGTMVDVQKEWAKETIGEGFRIDCLKRWKQGFSGRVPQDIKTVTNIGDRYVSIVVQANDPKFIWAIPDNQVNRNPNLKQNEGWGVK